MFRVKHARGEVIPDASLVAQLLREQFPQLAGENVRPSNAEGSSNFVFRVGDECAVRLPRSDSYIADLLSEARWLPRLAPHLSVPVPEGGSSPSHLPCSRGLDSRDMGRRRDTQGVGSA